jgi:signal transduction histidine kinase
MNRTDDQKIQPATRTLALLNQQADMVRAELTVLRSDLARVQQEFSGIPAAQVLEANEQLVLAALRAQSIADAARRRLGELSRANLVSAGSPSGELGRTEHQSRVAELREANEQLTIAAVTSRQLEAEAELARSNQIKFLAMAAHELRNPLLPLRLAVQMMPRIRHDDELLAKLQATISGQVSHMARLINDLLDGSRISTGKFRLERSAIDLAGLLELAIESRRPAFDARRHRFMRLGEPGPFNVNGDAVRLLQVFSNLLENAAKYTAEGGQITLSTRVHAGHVVTTISDNGIGISAQALPHVFELFVQDEHAAVHDAGGLGIGLAVVSELVAAHGGTVVATSAGMNQGSQFEVTLPLDAVPVASA